MSVFLKYHPAEFIEEEMEARQWLIGDLLMHMGPFADKREAQIMQLAVEMYLGVREPGLLLSEEMAELFAKAFEVSPQLFSNLDKAWRASLND